MLSFLFDYGVYSDLASAFGKPLPVFRPFENTSKRVKTRSSHLFAEANRER